MRNRGIGFLLGYFVFTYPITYYYNGSLVYALSSGILGLVLSIMFIYVGDRLVDRQ